MRTLKRWILLQRNTFTAEFWARPTGNNIPLQFLNGNSTLSDTLLWNSRETGFLISLFENFVKTVSFSSNVPPKNRSEISWSLQKMWWILPWTLKLDFLTFKPHLMIIFLFQKIFPFLWQRFLWCKLLDSNMQWSMHWYQWCNGALQMQLRQRNKRMPKWMVWREMYQKSGTVYAKKWHFGSLQMWLCNWRENLFAWMEKCNNTLHWR